ncbi:hypothetical protein A7317_00680 [Pseudomonas fluorescens]|nr:hypothetical protein A7317_00680 [Pseudomonas fluorescens]PMX16965.1 hypothetical protein C1Y23_26890 [Pseudomonas sp. GW460-12]PMX28897.1 hypothetical protein C1Y24_32930 [Pseudomonas sp. MPR-R2A4]PMX36158.1 hypothetical protein C1Y26_27025 [Pseudomonas sp. MPR-R2A7]PMX48435.1 hypothetical protein C1Y17_29390 [Pseudomonas sp. MPR-R2A6]PMX81895.1 hypothetical protein C1Y21_31855 [Pseudomonas sp. MPR-R2A3]PMY09940.1 hypothetical protein C1Y22_23085 [Pseudomonas sp. MPR-R2A5]PNA25444.1 hypo
MWQVPINLRLGAVAQQTGIACGERAVVASGLAPRWAAQQPQNTAPELPDTLQRFYWGCYAAQRGASPLATKMRLFKEKF